MRTQKPKISILMAARNTASFVEEAVESVLAQQGVSFELLIADDGSTDSTPAKLKKYRRDPRVHLWLRDVRVGQGKVRNRLARHSVARYICPVDSDDVLLPGALKKMCDFLEAHPSIGLVYGETLMVHELQKGRVNSPPQLCGKDPKTQWELLGSPINHGGSLIRRQNFLDCGGYDERPWSIEDFGMLLRFQEMFPVHYLAGEVCYVWRRHPRSTTHRRNHGPAMLRLAAEAYERRKRRSV